MRKLRAFTAQALDSNNEIELEKSTSHHLLNVLRLNVGSSIILFNGKGGEYHARLTFAKKGVARAKVLQFDDVDNESPLKLDLYQGISRGDKMDFALQKATELGVSSITPLITNHSQFKGDEKQRQKKMIHWQHIVIGATQQSWRCKLPTINEPVSFEEAMSNDSNNEKIFLHTASLQKISDHEVKHQQSLSLYIGPEGGFSHTEYDFAKNYNVTDILLGLEYYAQKPRRWPH